MNEPIDDIALLAELQSGNAKSAYEQIFKKYYKLLYVKAYYMLGDEMEAEDLVQGLLGKIWENQLYHSVNTSLKAYLYKAVNNKCLDLIEKKKNEQKQLNEYRITLNHAPVLEEAYMVPDNGMSWQDMKQDFDAALSELPPQRMEAFNLVFLQEKKYREAAEKMGISINSVKTHLRIAVRTLRQRLLHLK
ncbi:sigma-70 family RNA polymerase sigma factor [Chitinophaga sp. MM2321]|uniref:RNA polymerase sigma factor n=1 Tax=Chitinophaga sp. MM2321 TaxID=3137178 RepID=UPI0032D571A1